MVNRTYRYHPGPSLSPFGYGLSYTTFNYTVEPVGDTFEVCSEIPISATVTNTGLRDGDEAVQVYLSQPYATVRQPLRQLVAFQRIHVKVGQSYRVSFKITKKQLSVMREMGTLWRTGEYEPGERIIFVGGGQPVPYLRRNAAQLCVVLFHVNVTGSTTPTKNCK